MENNEKELLLRTIEELEHKIIRMERIFEEIEAIAKKNKKSYE